MRALDFPLLADENIHFEVVAALAARGKDVRTVTALGLAGQADSMILHHAHLQGRVVLSHDSDFGGIAVRTGEPLVGIIYLRPGHIAPAFVLQMLDALESRPEDVEPPFLIVVERRGNDVRIRRRTGLGQGEPPL